MTVDPLPSPLDASYEPMRELGEGGMGRVVLARSRTDSGLVSVKLFHETDEEDQQVRFRREASVLTDLDHPALPRLRRFGVTDQGSPYLVLDYIEGRPLSEFPGGDPLEALIQVADALSAMHAAGLVHRDIKPENVLCDGEGRAWLIDLGIAWSADMEAVTSEGIVVGTMSYLSPARLRGEAARPADDWYAWAVTLYELHEGHPPYVQAEILEAARSGQAGRPRFDRLDAGSRRAGLIELMLQRPGDRDWDREGIDQFLRGEVPVAAEATDLGVSRTAPTRLQASSVEGALAADAVAQSPTSRLPVARESPLSRASRTQLAGAVGVVLLGVVWLLWPRRAPVTWVVPLPTPVPTSAPTPRPTPSSSPKPTTAPTSPPRPPSPPPTSAPTARPVPTQTSPPTPTPTSTVPPTPAPTRSAWRQGPDPGLGEEALSIWFDSPHHDFPSRVSVGRAELERIFGDLENHPSMQDVDTRGWPSALSGDRSLVAYSVGPTGVLLRAAEDLSVRLVMQASLQAGYRMEHLALDHDGSLLAIAGSIQNPRYPGSTVPFLHLWDLETLRPLLFTELDYGASDLHFSPDREYLFVARGNTLVSVFTLEVERARFDPGLQEPPVRSGVKRKTLSLLGSTRRLDMDSSERLVARINNFGEVHAFLRPDADGVPPRSIPVPSRNTREVLLSPDGGRLFTLHDTGELLAWDPSDPRAPLWTFKVPSWSPTMDVSPSGDLLAVKAGDTALILLRSTDGAEVVRLTSTAKGRPHFLADDRLIVPYAGLVPVEVFAR